MSSVSRRQYKLPPLRRSFWVMVALVPILFIANAWYEQADHEAEHTGIQASSPASAQRLGSGESQTSAVDNASSNLQIEAVIPDQSLPIVEATPASRALKNAEILNSLHLRSRVELAALAIGVADYFEQELLGYDDLYHFTDRLLRIEQNDKDDFLYSEPAIYGAISFANSESIGMGELWEKKEFGRDDSRIVAHMPAIDPEVLGSKALVSWSRVDDGEVLLLNTLAMDRESHRNNVWLEKPAGWAPGNYRVAIYSGDEQLTLLSSGQFQIMPSSSMQPEY